MNQYKLQMINRALQTLLILLVSIQANIDRVEKEVNRMRELVQSEKQLDLFE